MEACVLISGDFTPGGGMDRPNYELAWYLAETSKIPAHLVSHYVAPPLATHPNVVWHRVPRPFHKDQLGEPLLALVGRRVARRWSGGSARIVVNGGNCEWPDVNWTQHVLSACESWDAHAPLLFRLRSAWHMHSARKAELRAWRAAGLIITNSFQTRRHVIRLGELPESKVHTVYYGVDAQVFRPPTPPERAAARRKLNLQAEGDIVSFIGALGYDRRKGFDALFGAWKILSGDPSWTATLVAAGGGSEVELWRSRTRSCGLESRIRLLGYTEEIPALLAASDLLVSPTHYEGYGQAVHEALCCGVPALVTRCAAVAERYPEELQDLLLPDPPSAEAVAQGLGRWRSRRDFFSAAVVSFGASLRRRTWADMSRDIVHLIDSSSARPK